MKKNIDALPLFLTGIFVSTLAIAPFLLDLTLLPRFMSIGIFMILTVYLIARKGSLSIKTTALHLAYFAFTLLCCLSVFWARNKPEALFESSKVVLSFFVFMLSCFFFETQRQSYLNTCVKFSVVISIIAFIVGGYQFINIHQVNRDSLYEVSGISGHKNLFSSFLFIQLYFLLLASTKLGGYWKKLAISCMVISIAFMLLLHTKAVWLGLAISMLLFAVGFLGSRLLGRFKIKTVVLVTIALLLCNLFFIFWLQPLIHKTIDSSKTALPQHHILSLEQERLMLWEKTFSMVEKHPAFGVGMGNWQIYFPDATLTGIWRAEDLNYTFQRPHNDLLWILSETGIVGLNLFLFFLFWLLFELLRTLKHTDQNGVFVPLLTIVFIVGYYSISFFDFPKERMEHLIWINILLAFGSDLIRNQLPGNGPAPLQISKKTLLGSAFVLLLIVFIGSLRYKGEYYTRKMYDSKNSGDLHKVIELGTKAMSFAYNIDPTSVPLNWYIGNARASLSQFPGAQTDFLKAYHANPFNRNVINDLASGFAFNKQTDSAKKYYVEAARISPRFDEPKLNLAALYLQEQNYDSASYWLRSIYHDSPRRSRYEQMVKALSPVSR